MAGTVINFCCPHPHFPPISPHSPPFFLGHVAQYTPPQPPKAREKCFFWGFGAMLFPFFHKKSVNSHSRSHFPPFFLLGAIFQRHYPLTSGSG